MTQLIISRELLKYDPGFLKAALEAGLQKEIPYYRAQQIAWKLFGRKSFLWMAQNDKIPISQADVDLLDRIYQHQ